MKRFDTSASPPAQTETKQPSPNVPAFPQPNYNDMYSAGGFMDPMSMNMMNGMVYPSYVGPPSATFPPQHQPGPGTNQNIPAQAPAGGFVVPPVQGAMAEFKSNFANQTNGSIPPSSQEPTTQYNPNAPVNGAVNPYSAANPYASFVANSQALMNLTMLNMLNPHLNGGMQGLSFYPMVNGAQPGNPAVNSGRTVYVGNLPADVPIDEILNLVRFGPLDSVKLLPEKSCVFITFLDTNTAAAFHSDAIMRKVKLYDHDLKIGWGKATPVPPNITLAVQQHGATRNVYLGNLDENLTEQALRDDLVRFGPIDQVKIVRDRAIAFVHFLSIGTAIKVVAALTNEEAWQGKKVNYGKDRCAYVPKNQHQQQQHNLAAAAMGSLATNYGYNGFNNPAWNENQEGMKGNDILPGNRTVYLGNIHPETTLEEICNAIRGGILHHIKYLQDKHICFVTFVDYACAMAFYQTASFQGLTLHNRRLKIGWGKHPGPTPPGIAMVVQTGGSRNVYVGNIEDFEKFNEEKLRQDFGEYGDIELINALPTKNACFVNFTNIANAIKAIEGIKQNPEYQNLRISYGKDRCGGSPKNGFFKSRPVRENGYGGEDEGTGEAKNTPPITPKEALETTPIEFGPEGKPIGGAGNLVLDETSTNNQ